MRAMKVLRNILFSSIFFLILLELLLRLIGYHYCPLALDVSENGVAWVGKSDGRARMLVREKYFDYDPVLIWRPKKSYKIFNAQGLRGDLLDPVKEENEFRVIAVGDSNTLGPRDGMGWFGYFSGSLKEKYPNIKTANAGVWGYSSWQGLNRFNEILPLRPDVVLISFGSNDGQRATISDRDYISGRRILEVVTRLRVGQFFLEIFDKIDIAIRRNSRLIPRVSFSEYEENIWNMVLLAKQNHIRVFLLTRPFIGISRHPLWWKNFCPQYNALTKKIAESEGVPLVDVFQFFEDKDGFFKDESHFNDAGSRVAARRIFDVIKSDLPDDVLAG